MTNESNRPAFPVHPDAMAYDEALPYEHQRGMTLRQWYAVMAMQGFIAEGAGLTIKEIVKQSWIMADAMLKHEESET